MTPKEICPLERGARQLVAHCTRMLKPSHGFYSTSPVPYEPNQDLSTGEEGTVSGGTPHPHAQVGGLCKASPVPHGPERDLATGEDPRVGVDVRWGTGRREGSSCRWSGSRAPTAPQGTKEGHTLIVPKEGISKVSEGGKFLPTVWITRSD